MSRRFGAGPIKTGLSDRLFQMHAMKLVKGFLSFLILVLFAVDLLADPAGTLYLVSGKIKVERQETDIILRESGRTIPVFVHDMIQTAAKTRARIEFVGRPGELNLYSLSVLKLDEMTLQSRRVALPVGKSRFQIPRKTSGKKRTHRFRVKTVNALIEVKGTDFVVASENGVTRVLGLSGVVALSNVNDVNAAVHILENQASMVRHHNRPTAPVVIPEKTRESIVSEDQTETFRQIRFGTEINREQAGSKKTDGGEKQQQSKGTGKAAGQTPRSGSPEEATEEIDIDEELQVIEDAVTEMEEGVEEAVEQQLIEIKIEN